MIFIVYNLKAIRLSVTNFYKLKWEFVERLSQLNNVEEEIHFFR